MPVSGLLALTTTTTTKMEVEAVKMGYCGSETRVTTSLVTSPWPSFKPTTCSRTRASSSLVLFPPPLLLLTAPFLASTMVTAALRLPASSTIISSSISRVRFAAEQECMSADVIKKAFQATEEGFLSLVSHQFQTTPQLATVGSCCLVCVISDGTLYVANAGDSRAVLGQFFKSTPAVGDVHATQLSAEHNASIESVRRELHALHPDHPDIVLLKHNVWRVKGIIQVSRSIGDVYLKRSEFNREPLYAKFRLRAPFSRPLLSAEPSITVHTLQPHDQFIICASDGLWEHMSNQEAVEIVHTHPRNGIAKRLVKMALKEAAKKREMRYSDLKKIDRGVRRHFHDDITVIVVFFDTSLVVSRARGPAVSVRGAGVNLPHNSLAPCTTAGAS
ncbi:PREDICTED: probable protein phosphatase 2C 64 isoform X2 [Brassica oleracea var. oleracea]|uniref:probable protein phosphatase 2C 64 isoform X2 n=1 Tax=Brassica oleracea var. oleracea TaxID=109376 RepID=UPI0006A6B7DC|nr:PREDICTED: probable protein phosphatase 2C 64 isoform X2 [Brassica oleracea var. oleracea]